MAIFNSYVKLPEGNRMTGQVGKTSFSQKGCLGLFGVGFVPLIGVEYILRFACQTRLMPRCFLRINAALISEKKCEAPCYLRHHPWHPIDCWFQLSHPEQYIWDGVRNKQVNSPGCLKPQPTCAENLTSDVWHWVFPVPMKSVPWPSSVKYSRLATWTGQTFSENLER